MPESANNATSAFAFDFSALSLQVVSFLEIGLFVLFAVVAYFAIRKLVGAVGSSGALEKRTFYFQVLSISTFLVPGLIFLYGLTLVSQESLFVSLLFFVIASIVFGFSLVEPAKAILSSLLINARGELRVGDYITMDRVEGEIQAIGAFNILVISKTGSKTYIPNSEILSKSYEVHAKKGGPSIMLNVPMDKISKKNLERLAHLCPFKRNGSDVRITTSDGQHKLSIEIVNRDSRAWVTDYFERHYQ